MSNSAVSDKGLQLFTATRYPRRNMIRNLTDMMEDPESFKKSESLFQYQYRPGCPKLRHLNLQSCTSVTDKGILCVLENVKHLKTLEYHQNRSVLEILIKFSSSFTNEELTEKVLNLREVEHGYPYSLCPLSDHVSNLSVLLPHLTTITLVTTDSSVSLLVMFTCLSRVTLELEDYVGEGFIELLSVLGHRLEEINLTCSSEPDTDLVVDQLSGQAVQEGQLFNFGLLCAGLLVNKVHKLSISGCGLVSSAAINTMGLHEKLDNLSWQKRQSSVWFSSLTSLIIMSYTESQTVHSGLLKSVVTAAKDLEFFNLEGSFGSFLTDSYISSILSSNSLSSLRTLDICVSELGDAEGRIPLTCDTVHLVLATCNNIKELRITDWSIDCAQFWILRRMVRLHNWDILITRKCSKHTCTC